MPATKPPGRRRRLEAYSRHAKTPANWVIEWSPDGRDYLSLGPHKAPDFETGWPVLRQILEDSEDPMSREQILRLWPERSVRPRQTTLWTWLDRLIQEGEIFCRGDGTKREPHRYYLPNMEMKWQERAVEKLNKMFGLGRTDVEK